MVVASCSKNNQLEDIIQQYQSRLSNIIQQPLTISHSSYTLSYPKMAELKADIETVNIDITTFSHLQSCGIANHIATRNTALGKIQLPSVRYIYEVKLIHELKRCMQTAADLTSPLSHWLEIKQSNLPLVWANLVQTSIEMKYALTGNTGYLHNEIKGEQTINAIRYLTALYETPDDNPQLLESHLATLKQSQLPAKIIRSQHLLTTELNNTTQWLKHHTASITCESDKQKKQVLYLANVFRLFFVDQLQPLAGRLNNLQYHLLPLWEIWLSNPHVNQRFKMLLQQQTTSFTHYQSSIQQHVKYWQVLFKKCGITPV